MMVFKCVFTRNFSHRTSWRCTYLPDYCMTLRFYLVPFVTIFLKAINPGPRKSYVIKRSSVKLNQSKQALVFNSEPIGLVSFPGGTPSHASPECPGSIHEGGELGYLGRAHLP